MPTAKTHDLITFTLALPTAAAAYYFTGDWALTFIATLAMLFGGLMFGPDLDIQSKQYTRWGPVRFIWWPYKVILPHRSRFSHGIILGTIIRVFYFLLVVTLLVAAALLLKDWVAHDQRSSVVQVQDAFSRVVEIIRPIKHTYLLAAFAGLWFGAASHTVSDVIGSFLKGVKRSI